jgi:NAD(P)-dependent dehydrogenase (short-subunit alcohol dehydrogenase family)
MRDLAVLDAPIRGWLGVNDAQRGPLRHFASKGLGVSSPLGFTYLPLPEGISWLIGAAVFVAGGTSGINLGIAEGFAAAGAARVAVMSRSPQKVDAAVTRLQALGDQATGEAADLRDPEATRAALRHAHAAFGDIDVLVSGAAGNFPAAALDMSPLAATSVVLPAGGGWSLGEASTAMAAIAAQSPTMSVDHSG